MKLFDTDRVLVPIDFSEESFRALQLTLEYVKDPAHVYVFHVLTPLNPGEPGMVWEKVNQTTRINHIKKILKNKFDLSQYEGINFEFALGDPSLKIINFAREKNMQLIVIPSHGRKGIGRFFIGSVAEKVIRYAHCPVLVLRRNELH